MADFAKAQLLKYGWTEGKGLGKNENGIIQALKPKLKFDTTGVGHKENWEEWWETAFNKAANSITIESQGHEVSISSKSSEDDSSRKNTKKKKAKNNVSYGNFVKTFTLFGDTLVEESKLNETEEKVEVDVIHTPLTDEELFKACGGRTAHKGARHGLKLNGKLQRIAEQESKLLLTMISKEKLDKLEEQHRESVNNEYQVDSNANTILPVNLSPSEENPAKLSKSTRKKQKRRMNDLVHQLNTVCNITTNEEEAEHSTSSSTSKKNAHLKRKRRKEKTKSSAKDSGKVDGDILNIPLPEEEKGDELNHRSVIKEKKKNSKRARSKSHCDKNTITVQVDEEIEDAPKKFKKSHNTRDTDLARLLNDHDADISDSEKHISDDVNTFSRTEADRLNARIKKKKDKRLRKQQFRSLDKITECLKAVHFDTDRNGETVSDNKKLMTLVENLVVENMAENKSEHIKQAGKKKKKKSKKMK